MVTNVTGYNSKECKNTNPNFDVESYVRSSKRLASCRLARHALDNVAFIVITLMKMNLETVGDEMAAA